MFDNTLLVLLSDNGGPVYNPGSANNFPLRGGKYADFEGGVRVNAFAAGGRIPTSRRGTVSQDLVHIADLFATFLRLARFGTSTDVDVNELAKIVRDDDAASAGLPPVDSMDAWGAIAGTGTKRTEIHLSTQAIIKGRYKLVVGRQPMNGWQGPFYPNATGKEPGFPDADVSNDFWYDCGPAGCLFDVFADPTEHHDLALELPQTRKDLLDRLGELNEGVFAPNRGKPSRAACVVAAAKYGGFYGPFVGVGHFPPASSSYSDDDESGASLRGASGWSVVDDVAVA